MFFFMDEIMESAEFNPLKIIEDHAEKCNMTPYRLLLTAGMDPSCISRWRKGSMPNSRTLNRLLAIKPPAKVDSTDYQWGGGDDED